jgi:ParB-like chromosome segregation protein Spo0J
MTVEGAGAEADPIRATEPSGDLAPEIGGADAAIGAADAAGAARALLEGRHLQVVQRPIGELRGYARNARLHSPEQIASLVRSMREFGWTAPIIADGTGEVIAGHGRLAAAVQLGLQRVPVVTLEHLTAAQRRALVIADNQLALAADWDEAMLSAELGDLADLDFDLSLMGFDDDALRELLSSDAAEIGLPALPEGERAPFHQMAFTLHEQQAQRLRQALALISAAEVARWESINPNRNANALAALAERVLAAAGDERSVA